MTDSKSDAQQGLPKIDSEVADATIKENPPEAVEASAAEESLVRFPQHLDVGAQAAETLNAPRHFDPNAATVARGEVLPPASSSRPMPVEFGRYRIKKELGRGAMGAVFLALDRVLDREVALKVPQFGPDDGPDVVERFYREARAMATLDHPNLCSVYDVGEFDGFHYLTMAYINGHGLDAYLKGGKSHPSRQVAAVMRKLAIALDEAHCAGVVHRDLKPANIMLDKKNEPIIMDFGLARRRNENESTLTQAGQIIGTPSYMSPEQVQGHQEKIGPHSDVYALGVICYQLLTGRLPFKGTLTSVMVQIMTTEPPSPSEVSDRKIDVAIEAICLKAMAKKIDDRYQTAGELAKALRDYLKGKPPRIDKPSRAEPQKSRSVKNPPTASLTGAEIQNLANDFFAELAELDIGGQQNSPLAGLGDVARSVSPLAKSPTASRPRKLSPKRTRRLSQTWRRISRRTKIITASCGGGLIVLLGVVLLVPGKKATPRVETNDSVTPSVRSDEKWVTWFENDTTNWNGLPNRWRVEKGVLIGSTSPNGVGQHTYLVSDRTFRDFEMKFEVRLKGNNANSGLQIRSEIVDPKQFVVKGPQVDIGPNYWGSLYGEKCGGMMKAADSATVSKILRPNDFNELYVRCVGKHVTIRLNGTTTVEQEFSNMPNEGIIAWQLHQGESMEIVVRNIQFKDLSTAPSFRSSGEYVDIFDGQTMNGWEIVEGDMNSWNVENGSLVGTAGYLTYTVEEFDDLEVRVQCRLNRRGNSGVYVRAKSGSALDGYEAQISNDLSQATMTGGIWALATFKERLVDDNEWFTLEFRAVGNQLTVKINGKQTALVIDKENRLTSGKISLQAQGGRNTRVEFRRIQVRRI